MRQLLLSKGKAEIDFNARLYPREVIEQTAAAFSNSCKAGVIEKGSRLSVLLTPSKGLKPRLCALNFCNYALALRQSWD